MRTLIRTHAFSRSWMRAQDVLTGHESGTDASGNPILQDIAPFLKSKFSAHFKVGGLTRPRGLGPLPCWFCVG